MEMASVKDKMGQEKKFLYKNCSMIVSRWKWHHGEKKLVTYLRTQ